MLETMLEKHFSEVYNKFKLQFIISINICSVIKNNQLREIKAMNHIIQRINIFHDLFLS